MTSDGKIRLSKLARIDHRLAELQAEAARLLAERARLFDAMAENDVDIETGRKSPTRHVPAINPVAETDRVRARVALRDAGLRRKVGR